MGRRDSAMVSQETEDMAGPDSGFYLLKREKIPSFHFHFYPKGRERQVERDSISLLTAEMLARARAAEARSPESIPALHAVAGPR